MFGVRMQIDEAGHHHALGPVDDIVGRAGIVFADVGDGVAVEGNIDLAHVDVASRLCLPGDGPIGVFDDGNGHRDLLGRWVRRCAPSALAGAGDKRRSVRVAPRAWAVPQRGSVPQPRGNAWYSGTRAPGASRL